MLTSLAYLGISTPRVADWPPFASDILGCQVAEPGRDGALRLRVDDVRWRIEVRHGDVDDIEFIGWTLAEEADLASYEERLVAAGITVNHADGDLLAEREVDQLAWFMDPFGLRHELAVGLSVAPGSFRPGRAMGGFVTGEQGLGHVVLIVPDLDEAHRFFVDTLDFRLSDKIKQPSGRTALFYNAGSRHHALALVGGRGQVGAHHLMLEVRNLDDVGTAYDMCVSAGVPIRKTIGRHTNDNVISFYPTSPSGLHLEYGYGGITVDPSWEVKTYTAPSIWGHREPEDGSKGPGILRP